MSNLQINKKNIVKEQKKSLSYVDFVFKRNKVILLFQKKIEKTTMLLIERHYIFFIVMLNK
jgi:hypothetical protein